MMEIMWYLASLKWLHSQKNGVFFEERSLVAPRYSRVFKIGNYHSRPGTRRFYSGTIGNRFSYFPFLRQIHIIFFYLCHLFLQKQLELSFARYIDFTVPENINDYVDLLQIDKHKCSKKIKKPRRKPNVFITRHNLIAAWFYNHYFLTSLNKQRLYH